MTEGKYYGVEIGACKGFITRRNYGFGNFVVLDINELTQGNRWNFLENASLFELIRQLQDNRFWVREFDTSRELLLWLAI
jgi:hypothetical protein